MITSRINTKLNYPEVLETIVNVLSDYIIQSKIKTMIIGLSGGLDSTVSSAICRLVSDKINVPLIGVSLPCSTNKGDEINGAKLAGLEFCSKFIEQNIEDSFINVENACTEISSIESTAISQGNIKARLRMIYLYDLASKTNGIVIGTSNITERLTGFWTLHGDEGDINPIGGLWKTEVYELAKYLLENVFVGSEALKASIEIMPTDGNGVSNSDSDQIMPNHTYEDIDAVLKTWDSLSPKMKSLMVADNLTESIKGTVFEKESDDDKNKRIDYCKKHGEEFKEHIGTIYGEGCIRTVIQRSINTSFKRKRGELFIGIEKPLNGEILLASDMPKNKILN